MSADERRVIVTGFEPFGEDSLNPSMLLAQRLDGQQIAGRTVHGVCLPVDISRLQHRLDQMLDERPAAVISFGQAGGRCSVDLERVAVNTLDFRVPDNSGAQIRGGRVVEDGPDAYLSRLPLADGVGALRAAGIPASISNTAGLYICNAWMYLLLHAVETRGLGIRAGFVHLPYLPEQAAGQEAPKPSMSLDLMERAARLLIEQSASNAEGTRQRR